MRRQQSRHRQRRGHDILVLGEHAFRVSFTRHRLWFYERSSCLWHGLTLFVARGRNDDLMNVFDVVLRS